MSSQELGKLEKVDLHEVWPREATDFTPWLEQHISALGDALGMELEIQMREAPVGDFSLDLLARDLVIDRIVVIENQLTQTDHRHLGQLLTYASGYDAGAIVWLAREMREEHRQALDWLNQRTDENTEFFGVVVELVRIDNSRPAVNFKLVAFPNEWRKTNVSASSSSVISERGEAYRDFFQGLIDSLREDYKFTTARKGQPRQYYAFASGLSGIEYIVTFPKGGIVRVELYIDVGDASLNKNVFDGLYNMKEIMESELKENLVWERLDTRRACRVSAVRPGSIDNPDSYEEIRKWAIERLLKFKTVFPPKLSHLID